MRHLGVTMIELMVTISIVAILAVIAVPNLSIFLVRSQRQQVVSDFNSSLALAKSEAIKRGTPVTLRATTAGRAQLALGWVIFVDPDRLAIPNGNTTLVASQDAYPAGQVVLGQSTASPLLSSDGREYFHFDSTGRNVSVSGAAGAASVRAAILRSGEEKAASLICISWGGRVRVIREATASTTC
jgi:type IV fimbrial biogenesis protein FimT